MSLDVYLYAAVTQKSESDALSPKSPKIFIREDGVRKEISRTEWDARFPGKVPVVVHGEEETNLVFQANITHNLNKMAEAAGIYKELWRPEEVGITKAHQLVRPLAEGLHRLVTDPAKYREFNAKNGWGKYENLVEFVASYIAACTQFPDADVKVWR